MRETLEKMYVMIHGGEDQVNMTWLRIHTDEEIIFMICEAGRLGVRVSRLSGDYNSHVLAESLRAYRRQRDAESDDPRSLESMSRRNRNEK